MTVQPRAVRLKIMRLKSAGHAHFVYRGVCSVAGALTILNMKKISVWNLSARTVLNSRICTEINWAKMLIPPSMALHRCQVLIPVFMGRGCCLYF